MKIISNFRDYYDYVSAKYNGGDPKIVYVRPFKHTSKIKTLSIDHKWDMHTKRYSLIIDGIKEKIDIIEKVYYIYRWMDQSNNYTTEDNKLSVKGIVIGNKHFTCINNKILNNDIIYNMPWISYPKQRKIISSEINNITDNNLVHLCRIVGLPVFSYHMSHNNLYIDSNIPNLGNIGIPKFIDADHMYQDLSYFIGNTMKINPDGMDDIKVADKDKIISHGFDVKKSFRNIK